MFRDASHFIADNTPGLHYGVAVLDVDGDDAFELFIAGFGAANRILKWTGGHFADIHNEMLADSGSQTLCAAAGDVDGDGHEEIYLLNSDTFTGPKRTGDRLLSCDDGQWRDVFDDAANQCVRNHLAGRSVACIDRLGTGRYGFVVANYGGPMRLYEIDADGRLRDHAPLAGLDAVSGGRSLLCQPLVSDRCDIFCGIENGRNYLYVNDGDGTFEDVAQQMGVADQHAHARGVAMVDLLDAQQPGLVLGNWLGPHRMFARSSREDRFMDIADPRFSQPTPIRTVIAADFDNDGQCEVFMNNIDWPNRLYAKRRGVWIEVEAGDAIEPDGLGTGAAIGDFDGDGRLELLISHGESAPQPLSLYRCAAGEDHNHLRVQPTTRAGAPARGATVELLAAGRTQIRAIDAGSGYLCQMEPVAHFGLGLIDAVDEVRIAWPDGARSRIEQPNINTTLRVMHPGATRDGGTPRRSD